MPKGRARRSVDDRSPIRRPRVGRTVPVSRRLREEGPNSTRARRFAQTARQGRLAPPAAVEWRDDLPRHVRRPRVGRTVPVSRRLRDEGPNPTRPRRFVKTARRGRLALPAAVEGRGGGHRHVRRPRVGRTVPVSRVEPGRTARSISRPRVAGASGARPAPRGWDPVRIRGRRRSPDRAIVALLVRARVVSGLPGSVAWLGGWYQISRASASSATESGSPLASTRATRSASPSSGASNSSFSFS